MLLEGIAQVLLSIDCMNEDFWEGSHLASCEGSISGGSQTAMAPNSAVAQPIRSERSLLSFPAIGQALPNSVVYRAHLVTGSD